MWLLQPKLDAHAYKGQGERSAYRAGYSDGFFGLRLFTSNEPEFYHAAYTLGFWEGAADNGRQVGAKQ